jgi:hypothetical protein
MAPVNDYTRGFSLLDSTIGLLQGINSTIYSYGSLSPDSLKKVLEHVGHIRARTDYSITDKLVHGGPKEDTGEVHGAKVALTAYAFIKDMMSHGLVHEVPHTLAGALLHDCGKNMLPQELTQNPRLYGPEDKEAMKQHPLLGLQLMEMANANYHIREIVAMHHHGPGGDGYPFEHHPRQWGMAPVPNRETMVVSVCDHYVALSNHRCYREAMPLEDTLRQLEIDADMGRLSHSYVWLFGDFMRRETAKKTI